MRKRLSAARRVLSESRGFTLLEMAAVTAILTALTGFAAVAINGAFGNARVSAKSSEMKNVDTSVGGYRVDFESLPLVAGYLEPTEPVATATAGGSVKIIVDTSADDFVIGVLPTGVGVVECSTAESVSIRHALNRCLGPVAFDKLVANYLKRAPKHAGEDATDRAQGSLTFDDDLSTPDIQTSACTLFLETCEFYSADRGNAIEEGAPFTLPGGSLKVWNVDGVDNVIVIKPTIQYGR